MDVGDAFGLHGHAIKKRWVFNVGRGFIPLVELAVW